jgi:microcin C transport system substrate-binding protein
MRRSRADAPADPGPRAAPGATRMAGSLVLAAVLAGCGAPAEREFVHVKHRVPFPEDALEYFKQLPEFFTFKKPEDLPADLKWESNASLDEIGSPDAKRGGTYYYFVPDFPRTFRFVGPDANGAFRSYIHDNNTIKLVESHPDDPGLMLPALAREWAAAPDRKTIFFHLDPDATYSDGVPIRTDDFLFCFYFMRSPHIVDPWYNDHYTKNFRNITKYDDLTFSVTAAEAKPDLLYLIGSSVYAKPMHFYQDFAEDYVQRYQWRMEPTTGAYEVLPENVDKGRSVTLTAVPNWWAREKKHYRYRYNPDRLNFRVIRDRDKWVEFFKNGELDLYGANGIVPDIWYNKFSDSERNVVNGGIVRATFYNQIPRPSWSMSINSMRPILKDRNVRQGLQYASNWDLVCQKIFRGDAARMQTTSDGYVAVTFPNIKARPFDPSKAAECFAKAGFTERGPDSILRNAAGDRLSFTITSAYARMTEALTVIQQEAKKAGVEIKLEIVDFTTAWKKIDEKKHDISFGAKNTSVELYPRFWETFHGSNAYKPDGSVQTDTNNETQTASKELDAMIEAYDKASSMDEIIRLARQIQAWLHEDAAFIPAFVEPFYRTTYWRWVKWPAHFNGKTSRDADEFMMFWVDAGERERTKGALKRGERFPVQTPIYDQFKLPTP